MEKNHTFKFSFEDYFKKIKTNQLIMICSLLSVIYVISGYIKWIEILVSLTALIFMITLPIQSALCVFMFLHSFTLSNIGHDSCFMVTLIGFCLILLVKYIIGVKKGTYPYYKNLVMTIALFYLFGTAFSLFRDIYRGSWLYYTYLPLAYLLFAMKQELNISQAMNYMFGGLLTSTTLSLLTTFFPVYQYDAYFSSKRLTAFINNPNYLYMRSMFVLTYYMYRYINEKISHITFGLIYVACAFITLATVSKTGFAMLALMSFIFIIVLLKRNFKKNIKVVAIFCACLLILGIIFIPFITNILGRFANAVNTENVTASLTTGRTDIWKKYLNATFASPWTALFGNGLLAQQMYLPHIFGYTDVHNFYIFLLFRFGLIGTCAFGYIVFLFIKEYSKEKPQIAAFLPLIFILLEGMCDNTFKCYNFTYYIFAIMILFMDCKDKPVKTNI